MTIAQAIEQLTGVIPDRTVTVNKQIGRFVKSHLPFTMIAYTITVHPGFDGEKCQQVLNKDGFDKPVADIIALAKQVAATPNEE
jgi:hypothetical protein